MAKMFNASVPTKGGPVEDDAREEKDPLVEFLMKKLYPEATAFFKPFSDNIKQNVKFYKGDQWTRHQPSYRTKSVTNYISQILHSEVALLTDRLPQISVRPVDYEGDVEIANTLKKLVEHVLYMNDWPEKFHYWVKDTSIRGTGYIVPIWNAQKNQGLGDIELTLEYPWQREVGGVIRDPSGEDNYFIIEKKVSMAEVYRMWPEKADAVKADLKDKSDVFSPENDKSLPALPIQSTDQSQTVVWDKPNVTLSEQYLKVPLHIFWIRDNSVGEIVKGQDEQKDIAPEPMYPNGRWVYVCNRRVTVDDKPCEVKHMPLIPLMTQTDPITKVSGISLIDFIKGSQADHNQMYALILDWLRAVTVPKLTIDPKARIDAKKIKNKWGSVLPAPPGMVRWENPPPLPNDSFHFIGEAKNNIEYVSGIQDVTQGRRPANVVSAEAINLLQEASKTVLRPKARLIEAAVKRLGQVIVDFIQAGYTTQRMMRIIGNNPGMGENVNVNVPVVNNSIPTIKTDLTIGDYDVYVEPDSTLPKSDIERMDRLQQLGQMGFVDRRAILENSGLPNWMEIEARMQAKEDEFKKSQQGTQGKPPTESIAFKDLPPAGKLQMAQQAGIQLDPQETIQHEVITNPPQGPVSAG